MCSTPSLFDPHQTNETCFVGSAAGEPTVAAAPFRNGG
jgi:hypothetical protein